MRDDWQDVALEEVADELTVGFVGSMAAEYVDVGIPFLRSLNVEPLRINKNDLKYISPKFHARIGKSRLRPGDVVIVRTGKPGACSVVPNWLEDANCSDLVIVRCGPRINNRFLAYYVNTVAARHVAAHLVGAVQQHFNVGSARTLRINLPPLVEQEAIAAVLGALDDKIELNRRMNATLEAMARALFQSWFVDFDPVRAKLDGRAPPGMDAETERLFPSEFEITGLGPIPRGWRRTTLGSETERCGGTIQTGPFGSQLHASDYVPDGVPVVMPKDISGRRVSTASIARIREQDADRLARHRLRAGDVVYSRRGDVERHALIGPRESGWLCGTGCLLVRLGPRWPSAIFASFALDRPETRAWLTQHAIGATMPNLNTGILSAVPLVMPPDSVAHAFARTVDQWQDLVIATDAGAATLAAIRDQLLPPLLAGEFSVAKTASLTGSAA